MATATVILFVVASMLGIGLQVSLGELGQVLRARGFLGRLLVTNFVVIPAVGVALAWLVPMAPALTAAFVLLACAPGGPSALQFTGKQHAALAHAGAAAFVLSLLAVVVSPVLMELALPAGMPVVVPYGRALGVFVLLLVIPLGLGVFVRAKFRSPAEQLVKPTMWVATLAFVGFVVLTLSRHQAATAALETAALLALLAFVVVCMVIGWLLGGPGRPTRRVLATASSMRNVALCIAIAKYSFPSEAIEIPLIAFSALMIPPNLLFFLLTRLRDWRAGSRV